MAAAQGQVIDAEIVSETPEVPRAPTRAETTARHARTAADALDRAGLGDLAKRARAVADASEHAQRTADAAAPVFAALASLARSLEDAGIVRHPPRRRWRSDR